MSLPGLNFTSQRVSQSAAQNTSIAFNPSIVTSVGNPASISSAPSGYASGAPASHANASGSDSVSPMPNMGGFYPTGQGWGGTLPPALYGDQTLVPKTLSPATQQPGMDPLVIGALALGAVMLFANG